MRTTFEQILKTLKGHEGGFSHRSLKADPGGPTNFGITQRTLSGWRGHAVSIDDVRRLTFEEATQIYLEQYWRPVRGDELPAGLDYAVFDYGVNSGPAAAVKALQRILEVRADGIVGLITLGAIAARNVSELINALCGQRLKFMQSLRNWRHNKNGWTRRVKEVRRLALSLVIDDRKARGGPVAAPSSPVPASSKALEEERSVLAAWLTPQGLSEAAVAVSGLGGMLAESGPLQWGFGVSLIVATVFVGLHLLSNARAA